MGFDRLVKDRHLSDIAEAIREFLGEDDGMTVLDMPDKIRQIQDVVALAIGKLVNALCWEGECLDIGQSDILKSLSWIEVR